MMSQSRSRKAPAMSGPVRARTTQAKASGDTANPQKPQNHPRSKSKSKIPKNMRDELENALVGVSTDYRVPNDLTRSVLYKKVSRWLKVLTIGL